MNQIGDSSNDADIRKGKKEQKEKRRKLVESKSCIRHTKWAKIFIMEVPENKEQKRQKHYFKKNNS